MRFSHLLTTICFTLPLLTEAAAARAENIQPLLPPPPPASGTSAPLPAADFPSLSVPASDEFWQRVRTGFRMEEMESPLVTKHEQWYANRPDYVARMMDRSRRYLYYVLEEVEKRGMPNEIALLPMIESAYNPVAYSVSRASGIWQFIPSTGKNFGLQQNWWYDGRRDIISATKGALDYLEKLYGMFGDWKLALAAYNCGEGAVMRAQERNRRKGLPDDYESIKIPDETRNYVPKLLAVRNIVNNPASYGLTLGNIPNKPYFAAVATADHIDVKLAAQLADISVDEFVALNPAHNRPVILQENANLILLPVDKVEAFRANLESYDKPLVSWQAYQPKKGERLDKLAPRFGLTVDRLKAVNGLGARSNVSNGQTLLVPLNGEEAEDEFEAFDVHIHPSDEPGTRTMRHTVRKGDNIASVAKRYHITPEKLKSLNPGLKQLKVGQSIVVVQNLQPTATKPAAHADSKEVVPPTKPGSKPGKPEKPAKTNKKASAKSEKAASKKANKSGSTKKAPAKKNGTASAKNTKK